MRNLLLVLVMFFAPAVFADDLDVKLEQILYPCVRVLSGNGGGSGTVIYSDDREGSGEFQTFILTNHHVIDNLIKVERKWDNLTQSWKFVENNELADVELFTYSNGGKVVMQSPVKAEIVAYVEDEDIALLKLLHPFKVSYVVEIMPKDKILRLFQEVYAIGCPLLVDPIFTKGEVTDLDYVIEKKSYIATSADIIWGNSGGAIVTQFDNKWYFVGIPSRGSVVYGQAVTYMGYAISPDRVRNFITTQKLLFLIDSKVTPTQSFEERKSLRKQNNGESGIESSSRHEEGH